VRFGPDYEEVRRLGDGTRVRLRLLRASDRAKLLAGFEHLSEESRYRRFFTAMPTLPEKVVDRLLDVDGWKHLAIGVEDGSVDTEAAAGWGIARFIRLEEAEDAAEAAVVVIDDMQRRGLGKLLLSRLAAAARERGITRFRAEVLRTNQAMVALLHEIDATPHATFDGPVAVYELAIPDVGEEEEHRGPIFAVLKLAATGLQVLARRLLAVPEP
jgi:GNAT superfamily N-acetyltransferase